MHKKNCHLVFGSHKSNLTVLEPVFQTAGTINPPQPNPINELIEGLLSAQQADRGVLHQLESLGHWLKLIEALTSAWKLLQYLISALDIKSQT